MTEALTLTFPSNHLFAQNEAMPAQSIINLANTMYAHQPLYDSGSDRLDAAQALLGVSPNSVIQLHSAQSGSRESSSTCTPSESGSVTRRDRCDSTGLDALAFLATKETASMEPMGSPSASQWEASVSMLHGMKNLVATSAVSSSSSSDDETMPPPPPRRAGSCRRRSVSNPEGMERWAPRDQNRLKFVLPASILEEEMAEASAAIKAKQELAEDYDEEANDDDDDDMVEDKSEEEEIDEADLTPDELLRRARSRLLEDLSEVNMNGEKGILMLPHSLDKYKEVYNQNGRIGIYTPSERAAIISRYQGKRTRRVWNKKIRYNCRKNLADRRLRVKGRFVRKEEQAKLAALTPTIPEDELFVSPESSELEDDKDSTMPDTSDPDAGFCPTDDLPYRRTRRHTIT